MQNRLKNIWILTSIVALFIPTILLSQGLQLEKNGYPAATTKDAKIAQKIVEKLASDEFGGRAPGTKGDTLSVEYISTYFKKLGLEVGLQEFNVGKDKTPTYNVYGILEGKSDNYIVVGAHYDHIGIRKRRGSSDSTEKEVHNGADDNASGVAALILLADDYNNWLNKPEDGIIFVAFGAEERGLVGAREFANNLPIAKSKIKAMVNIDMIGNLKNNRLIIGGVGTATEMENVVDEAIDESGGELRVKKIAAGTLPSDQYAFYKKEIPVLMFNTGITKTYHTPEDDAHTLNYNGIDSVVKLIKCVTDIIMEREELEFVEPENSTFKIIDLSLDHNN